MAVRSPPRKPPYQTPPERRKSIERRLRQFDPYSGSASISRSFEPTSPPRSIHNPKSKTRSRANPSRSARRAATNSAARNASARSTPYVLMGKLPMRKSSGYIIQVTRSACAPLARPISSLVARHCAHCLLPFAFLPSFKQKVYREQRRARTDCGVGDIEGRPLVRAYVDLYEVYDVAEPYAVAEISGDAREQQGDCAEYAVVRTLRAEEV